MVQLYNQNNVSTHEADSVNNNTGYLRYAGPYTILNYVLEL